MLVLDLNPFRMLAIALFVRTDEIGAEASPEREVEATGANVTDESFTGFHTTSM